MLQQNPFYWGSIYKVITAFGSIFADIHIVRQDSNGNPTKTILVPCEYGPKEKWYIRRQQNPMPGVDDQVEMVLPRMSYEMKNFQYDPSRKLVTTGQNMTALISDNRVLKTQFNPVPWNIGFELSLMTKSAEDSLMVIEQVIPFFTPDYTLSVKDIPDLNLTKDINFVLNGATMEDNWTGTFQERRAVIWTFEFTAKAYLYPPTQLSKIILDAQTNIYGDGALDSAVDSHATIVIYPSTASMQSGGSTTLAVGISDAPTQNYTITMSPNLGIATTNGTIITFTAPTVSTITPVTLTVTLTDDPRQTSSTTITINP